MSSILILILIFFNNIILFSNKLRNLLLYCQKNIRYTDASPTLERLEQIILARANIEAHLFQPKLFLDHWFFIYIWSILHSLERKNVFLSQKTCFRDSNGLKISLNLAREDLQTLSPRLSSWV